MEFFPKNRNPLSRKRPRPTGKLEIPPEQRSVSFEGNVIEYTLKRSGRRTIEFSVRPDSKVVVRAPWALTSESIDRKVVRRGRWILEQIVYFRCYFTPRPSPRYTDGETHFFLGEPYRLRFQRGARNSVECSPGILAITFRKEPDADAARRLLENWYREQARAVFSKSIERCWPAFQDDGYPKPFLAIRKMKRCWGSLSRKGKMTLNLELVRATTDCIDYVVTHELCHLAHPNHGPLFYRQLAEKLPEWKTLKQKLEQNFA